jgi:hypothetical protein
MGKTFIATVTGFVREGRWMAARGRALSQETLMYGDCRRGSAGSRDGFAASGKRPQIAGFNND